jgi:HK97 family phage major capsid protein
MNFREKIRELRRKRAALIQQARSLLDGAEAEERQLTAEELNSYDGFQGQIDDMATEIQRLERQLQLEEESGQPQGSGHRQDPAPNGQDPSIGMSPTDLRRYSLVRALRAAMNGDWRGAEFEREASQAVAQRLGRDPQSFFIPYDWMAASGRDLVVGTPTAGGNLVATDLMSQSFIELLRNKMIVRAAGATVLAGLVGDVAIPRQTGGATAYWVAESGAPTESQQTVDQVALTPKTVGAFTDISRKLLKQSSIDVEMFVRNDLATVLALAIDLAALHGSGASNQPTGIASTSGIGSVVGGTNGLAPAWSHIVDLESEVAIDNADVGALAYITNPKVRGVLKQTEKASGTAQFVWERGSQPLNGYPAFVTNQVASNLDKGTSVGVCSAIFYGNWADLLIGMWGGLDVLVDPYTGGTAGTVRVIELQDVDIAVRHAQSFAAMLDALTA